MNNDIIRKILTDLKVELSDEFDRNFERKAFFTKKWPKRKREGKGSLLLQTGKLRRSISARVAGTSVTFSSSEAYATIHNEGGEITVTAKMKKYFWAKYYELGGKVKYNKSGSMSKSSTKLSEECEAYKAMALMKVGSKITIPQRQFIGEAPEVLQCIDKVVKSNLNTLETQFKNHLKPRN